MEVATDTHTVSIVEMTSLVTKLLGPPEKIETLACFPTHLQRWMIFGTQHFKIYLHHWYGEDLNVDLRHYPERFISFGIVNSCVENSAGTLEVIPDRAAWMVLIAKSSHGEEKGAHN
jgi:hypothetical protein